MALWQWQGAAATTRLSSRYFRWHMRAEEEAAAADLKERLAMGEEWPIAIAEG